MKGFVIAVPELWVMPDKTIPMTDKPRFTMPELLEPPEEQFFCLREKCLQMTPGN